MTPRQTLLRAAFQVVALAGPLVAGSSHAQGASALRFSPANPHGIELTADCWSPISDHVSASSGVPLQHKTGRTSAGATRRRCKAIPWCLQIHRSRRSSSSRVGRWPSRGPTLVACKFSCAHLQNRKIPIDVVFAGNMDASFAQLYGAYRSFYQTAAVHLR